MHCKHKACQASSRSWLTRESRYRGAPESPPAHRPLEAAGHLCLRCVPPRFLVKITTCCIASNAHWCPRLSPRPAPSASRHTLTRCAFCTKLLVDRRPAGGIAILTHHSMHRSAESAHTGQPLKLFPRGPQGRGDLVNRSATALAALRDLDIKHIPARVLFRAHQFDPVAGPPRYAATP